MHQLCMHGYLINVPVQFGRPVYSLRRTFVMSYFPRWFAFHFFSFIFSLSFVFTPLLRVRVGHLQALATSSSSEAVHGVGHKAGRRRHLPSRVLDTRHTAIVSHLREVTV
jgi:hypothetical protein